ncbi:MAG: dTDP-glucose 4,6-dehydratase [Actinomycetota bacterium]
MDERILVTGGFGFIGSEFVRRASARGANTIVNVDAETYAGDRRRLAALGDRVDSRRLDIADEDLVELVRELRPRAVVHFAAESHVTRSEKQGDLFHRTNVTGTSRVMEAAAAADCDLVIHVSTDEVYGACHGDAFREVDKEPGVGLATSPYAQSKALADDVAQSWAKRIPVVIVRPTNCYGPWQHPEKAVARWTTRALLDLPVPVWGGGDQVRDWMFVEDACVGIELLLERGVPGETYNLGPEGAQRSNWEMALLIARAAERDDSSVYLTAYDRPEHDIRYAVDSSKIRDLGWRAGLGLEEGVARTVGWYRENASWWQTLRDEAEDLYADSERRVPAE